MVKKTDFANLKSDVDKLHIDELKNANLFEQFELDVDKSVPIPVDLRDIVKNVVKEDVYKAKIKSIEDKIPDITNLATKASPSARITKVKGEMASITNFTTNASLNAKINEAKWEIPNITN